MLGRTVRLKRAELRMMRASELRRLMEALGVSSEGCLEKAELVGQLEQAPDVVLEEDLEKSYDLEELRDLPLPLLRNLLERHRVLWDEEELSEEEERVKVMQRLAQSGWMGEAAREEARKEEERSSEKQKQSDNVKEKEEENREEKREKGNVQSEDSEKQAEELLESLEGEESLKNEADGSGVLHHSSSMWLRPSSSANTSRGPCSCEPTAAQSNCRGAEHCKASKSCFS